MNRANKLLFAIIFLMSPVFSNIGILGKLTLGDLAIITIFSFCLLFTRKINIICLLGILLMLIVSFLAIAYYLTSYQNGIFQIARLSFYIFSFFIVLNFLQKSNYKLSLVKFYILISTIFSLLLIIQISFYYFIGYKIIYINTPLDIEVNSILMLDIETQGFRSGGIFREPSYFAIFIAPGLYYSALFRRWYLWCLFALSTILSTSSLGYIFIGISILRIFKLKHVLYLFVAIFFIYLFNLMSNSFLPNRLLETLAGGGSFPIRITDPLLNVFRDGDILFPNFSILMNLADPDMAKSMWFNSLSYSVVIFGIIAIAPIILIYMAAGKNQITFITILIFTTHSLVSPYFLVVVILLILIDHYYLKLNFKE